LRRCRWALLVADDHHVWVTQSTRSARSMTGVPAGPGSQTRRCAVSRWPAGQLLAEQMVARAGLRSGTPSRCASIRRCRLRLGDASARLSRRRRGMTVMCGPGSKEERWRQQSRDLLRRSWSKAMCVRLRRMSERHGSTVVWATSRAAAGERAKDRAAWRGPGRELAGRGVRAGLLDRGASVRRARGPVVASVRRRSAATDRAFARQAAARDVDCHGRRPSDEARAPDRDRRCRCGVIADLPRRSDRARRQAPRLRCWSTGNRRSSANCARRVFARRAGGRRPRSP